MNCPKCNHRNSDGTKICELCGLNFTGLNTQPTKPKIKTSKEAVVSLLLAIVSPLSLMILAIPSIIMGLKGLKKIRNSKEELACPGIDQNGCPAASK